MPGGKSSDRGLWGPVPGAAQVLLPARVEPGDLAEERASELRVIKDELL